MGVTCEEFSAFNCSSLIRTTLMYKLMAVQWTGLMLGFQVWVYAISRKGIEHLGITLVLFSLWTSSLGKKKESSLQLHLWNLNICIEKVDAKCWLVEMTLAMMSLPLAHVFQCLFTFTLVSTPLSLAEIWQLSWQGASGELEVEFKFQRHSCKLSFLPPPCRQSALESLLTG